MSDDTTAAPTAARATFAVRAQYIKDLSFENPGAPRSMAASEPPEIQLSVSVNAEKLDDGAHEVELKLDVRATRGEDVAFIAELSYGGVFHIAGVPESQLRPLIMIECPRFLFPFARRVIADCTREGGFPPLMLDPIDFAALFRRSERARQGTNGGQASPTVN